MNSLENRLHIGLSLSLILLFVLLWFLGQKSMNELTLEFVGSRIDHDVESLLASLDISEQSIHLKAGSMPPVYQQPFSGHYFIIALNQTPIMYSRSLWDQSLLLPQLKTGERILSVTDGPDNQKLLQISMAFKKKGQQISIALAEDLTAINKQQRVFKQYFFVLSLIGLIFLLFIQSIILRLSFRPLETVCSDIKSLEDGQLLKLSEDVPSEILPLVQEVNHLLSLLETRLERSRNALGNLSHALKSPLNLLFQSLYGQSTGVEQQSIDAKKQIERINQLINRELKRARFAGKGGSTQRFKPQTELPELINVIKQIYIHRSLTINYYIEPSISSFADREDMLELMGNLLDNAAKWAHSLINIHITHPDSASDLIQIIIEDDGQTINHTQLALLIQRGTRLDESIDGYGLGLSIVHDIVKLYAGSIEIKQSTKLGGLLIRITIHNN